MVGRSQQGRDREKTRIRSRRSRCFWAFFYGLSALQLSSCSLVLLFPCSTVLSHTVLRKAWSTMDTDRVWSSQQTHKLCPMPDGQWTRIENFLQRQLPATGSPACLAGTMDGSERESPCCLLDQYRIADHSEISFRFIHCNNLFSFKCPKIS